MIVVEVVLLRDPTSHVMMAMSNVRGTAAAAVDIVITRDGTITSDMQMRTTMVTMLIM